MNYLTNYYKNLSEQLQEQVNQLQAILNEVKNSVMPTSKDKEDERKAYEEYKKSGSAKNLKKKRHRTAEELRDERLAAEHERRMDDRAHRDYEDRG